MTEAEKIVRHVLERYAGVYYVAGNETQRSRTIKEATRRLEVDFPFLASGPESDPPGQHLGKTPS